MWFAGSMALVALLTGCGLAGPSEEDTASYDVTDKVTAIQIEADSGAITLAFAAQPDKVKTSTDSGRTEVRVPEGPYNIAATTDSSDKEIDAAHDASAPRSIILSSDSGAIGVFGS
ncbi:hypothetical protein AB0M44_31605 [Streptosporangium subroseum]|uniref:hypothetical protein n=1 Tax=Streptosporangium subroseum TaxID=106412 RepID=UPI00343D4668